MIPSSLHLLFAAVAPWLALSLLLIGRNPHPGARRIMASLLASALLLACPVAGSSVARWVALLESNPSLTLTLLLALLLFRRISGRDLLRPEGWTAAWIFGSIAALVLYPMALGLTRIDPCTWGWGPWLPVVATVWASILILGGNRFGLVLAASIPAALLGVQESSNFWNLLIDPFYGATALLVGLATLMKSFKR